MKKLGFSLYFKEISTMFHWYFQQPQQSPVLSEWALTKNVPWLFRVCKGWKVPSQLYRDYSGIIINKPIIRIPRHSTTKISPMESFDPRQGQQSDLEGWSNWGYPTVGNVCFHPYKSPEVVKETPWKMDWVFCSSSCFFFGDVRLDNLGQTFIATVLYEYSRQCYWILVTF